MSIRTHIISILRQGVWASLTGGWCYDPAHSLLVNTIHLYLWYVEMLIYYLLYFAIIGYCCLLCHCYYHWQQIVASC
jgi:hypothetical protein